MKSIPLGRTHLIWKASLSTRSLWCWSLWASCSLICCTATPSRTAVRRCSASASRPKWRRWIRKHNQRARRDTKLAHSDNNSCGARGSSNRSTLTHNVQWLFPYCIRPCTRNQSLWGKYLLGMNILLMYFT
uniref:Secreted protein n=1 Tax=Cacopsylla melanoneura TaxID=428564 RepID=A0A8D9APQ1_9HEMI